MAKPTTTHKLRALMIGASAGAPFSLIDDTLKWVLLDTAFVPDQAMEFASEIAANEISGTGYASGFGGSGRKTVAGAALITRASGVPAFDCDDPTWAGLDAGQPGWAAQVKPVTSDADSPVLCFIKLTTEPTDGTDFQVHVPADGVFGLEDVTP